MNSYKWPLNTINHSYLDRIKLAFFYLNPSNQWSIGPKVKEFEERFAKYLGVKYVVATSSGSTANSILSHYWFDKNKKSIKNGRNQIILNGITWATNANPWIRDGFKPIFIDINLQDFSIDCDKLEKYLKHNHKKVSCVFVTSLIGFAPNLDRLEEICNKYKVRLFGDFCESGLTKYIGWFDKPNLVHIGRYITNTHSFYVGHLLCGCEMGCLATNNHEEYQEFLLYRNHGLLRSIKDINEYPWINTYEENKNELTDESFTFIRVGNNYRPTEINAYTTLLDLKRIEQYTKRRKSLYELYYKNLNDNFYLPEQNGDENINFCLPIIVNPEYKGNKSDLIEKAKKICDKNLIERRPIVSQTITRHSIYQEYGDYKTLKNCEYLTKYGFYVGLNVKVKEDDILSLTKELNQL